MLRTLADGPGALEIVLCDADNTVAWAGNVCVQVRTGRMTAESLLHIESVARLMRVRTTGPVGAIAVLEEGAELVSSEVREKQREVIARLMSDPRTFVAAVIAGDGVKSALLRSVTRLLTPRTPRIHAAANLPDAVGWMAEQLKTHTPARLMSIVAEVRAAAARASTQETTR